jgi:hypothetical protein
MLEERGDTPISQMAEGQLLSPSADVTIVSVECSDSELYRALFDLSQAISGH